MLGKQICKMSRTFRKQIAQENGIVYFESECYKIGDCNGYCDITEAETRWLNSEIQRRQKEGFVFVLPNFKLYTSKTDIKLLNLGKKTMRALRDVGIDSIEFLQSCSYEDLCSIPNIDSNQVQHIYDRLEHYEYISDIDSDDLPF